MQLVHFTIKRQRLIASLWDAEIVSSWDRLFEIHLASKFSTTSTEAARQLDFADVEWHKTNAEPTVDVWKDIGNASKLVSNREVSSECVVDGIVREISFSGYVAQVEKSLQGVTAAGGVAPKEPKG